MARNKKIFIGRSLSFCLPDAINKGYDPEQLFLIPSTRFFTDGQLEEVITHYSKVYWGQEMLLDKFEGGQPVTTEQVAGLARQLWREGRILQPRCYHSHFVDLLAPNGDMHSLWYKSPDKLSYSGETNPIYDKALKRRLAGKTRNAWWERIWLKRMARKIPPNAK